MKNEIWIGIAVGVFFVGIGVSYAIFSSTYNPNSMKFANQELFDQMMSQNPKMMANWMETMMQDAQFHDQVMDYMAKNPEQMNQWMIHDPKHVEEMSTAMRENHDFMMAMMSVMMNDPALRLQMLGHMTENPESVEQMKKMMGQNMMGSGMMSGSMMSDMQFNVDAPITMPLIDGYYNGEKVYFIHTEVSDKDISEMLTMMVNFPTLHVSELKNILPDDLAIVYIFTNGIPGSGPYGGGPFFFQIDIFDAVPGQNGYSQFRSPHLVTWSENSGPRLLTSVEELLEAEANGEVSIEKTDLVVNAPMIVWKSGGMEQTASIIQRMFESMPGVDGEVTNVDVDNYLVMIKLRSQNDMGMMDTGMMSGLMMESGMMEGDEAKIRELISEYQIALNNEEIEKISTLYSKQAIFIPPEIPAIKGVEEIGLTYEYLFSQFDFELDFDIKEVVRSENFAYVLSNSEGTITLESSETEETSKNQEIFILIKEGDNWKISRYMFNSWS